MEIKNENIIEVLTGENSLISTSLKQISIIDKNGVPNIEIIFNNFSKKSIFKTIKIVFSQIVDYSFSYNDDYIFSTVESVKLLRVDSIFYLSLDPDLETEEISSNDLDFIWFKEMKMITVNEDF